MKLPEVTNGSLGYIQNIRQLPANDGSLTYGESSRVPLSAVDAARLCALRSGTQSFFVLCTPEVLQTPPWFHLIERSKKLGLSYKGSYTTDTGVLDMIRMSSESVSTSQAKSAHDDVRVMERLLEDSDGLEWFRTIVKVGLDLNASDIHIEIREKFTDIRVRLDGVMRDVMTVPSSVALQGVASAYTMQAEERSRSEVAFNEMLAQAAMIPLTLGDQKVNLRYQTHAVVGGLDATLRILKVKSSDKILTLDQLGYLPQQVDEFHKATASSSGGVFVAGVTGSGKTTTLNTLLSGLIQGGLRKIISIEDPVEYIVKGVSHYSIQRSAAGSANNPFLAAMMAFLRMDPDVGMFGEIRDKVSANMAEAAIQTGHKILTTVHATSALGIIGRLCSSAIGLSRDSLCAPGFISALVYQVLMPLNCPHCKLPARSAMDPKDLQPYHDLFGLDIDQIYVASNDGCSHCRIPGIDYSKSTRVGVKGVKVAAEVLLPDEHVLQLLLKGDDFGAKRYCSQQRVSRFDEPDMTGKEVWAHVLYDISRGAVDPFYFEYTFGAPILYRNMV